MVVVAVLVLVASAATATAGRKGWSIDPPADYAESTAAALQMPELQQMQRELIAGAEAHEIREFLGERGGAILAVWYRAGAGSPEATLARWEGGLRASLTRVSDQFQFRRTLDRTAVVLEALAGVRGGRRAAWMRSIAGRTTEGALLAAMALCMDTADACDRALASLTLDRKGLVPVLEADLAPVDDTRPRSRQKRGGLIDTSSKAYEYGSVAGVVLVGLLVLVWLRSWWRRKSRG
jgi:hypothetical protein